MDISQFDYQASAEAGYTFALKHPETGEDTDITITVLGSDSKEYRKAFTAEVRRANEAEGETDADESNARVYSKCVTGWDGLEENGKAIKCTTENAYRVLERYTWIAKQVAAAVEKRANFTKAQEKA